LAIEGKQPTINENPEIISKADLTADPLDPVGEDDDFVQNECVILCLDEIVNQKTVQSRCIEDQNIESTRIISCRINSFC